MILSPSGFAFKHTLELADFEAFEVGLFVAVITGKLKDEITFVELHRLVSLQGRKAH